MANQQAWADRQRLLDLYHNAQQELAALVRTSDEIQETKAAILADAARKAEFQQLMLEDPNLTTAQVLAVIEQIKTMADYVVDHPI